MTKVPNDHGEIEICHCIVSKCKDELWFTITIIKN